MELINQRHKEIQSKKSFEGSPYIHFYRKSEIHFSVKAVERFGLYIGLYVHFVIEDGLWYFYTSADKDGFVLMASNRRHCTAIYNGALTKYFLKREVRVLPCKYPLIQTEIEMNGQKLIKLDLVRPIENERKHVRAKHIIAV